MANSSKPNILFIMADDIGWFNLSCYNHGIMGYRTPNLDRIAREGAMFTDFYGQQSCTAGRAAFITGQQPIRTGLTKVGMPGATLGLKAEDPTVAQFLKNLGYTCGQFGKNHLGDRNEHLPTVHGFDEFFGNLYHLNAEEEPEYVDYPKDPNFRKMFGPRGVLKSKATENDDPTIDPVFGKVGRQTIENTGPLTKKRMETVDEEFLASALDFMDRKTKEGQPWFCYFNPTRMHVFTHLKPSSVGKTGHGLYPDGMVELDGYVGQLLEKLESLGVTDNTIVVFTTDNGAEVLSWPDGGATPFRGEKDTNWEGGWRVPCVMRWPGVIQPGQSDDGDLMALRVSQYKIVFSEQRSKGLDVWREPLSTMRIPKLFNLRSDPFERGEESFYYNVWFTEHVPYQYVGQALVHEWLQSFQEFPPRQKAASFSIDQIVEKMMPHS